MNILEYIEVSYTKMEYSVLKFWANEIEDLLYTYMYIYWRTFFHDKGFIFLGILKDYERLFTGILERWKPYHDTFKAASEKID